MTIESALAFAGALLLWVFIPGPAILAIVARSITSGFRSALYLIVGILSGDLFYITIVLVGLSALGKILGDLFWVIRMLGAIYLIFLGIKLWLKPPVLMGGVRTNEKPDRIKTWLGGFALTLGNPKAILFHLGFLPTFFDLSAITVSDGLFIILEFMAILLTSLTLYAYAASKGSLFFQNQRRIRFLNRASGTVLIGAGIAIATRK